MRRVGWVAMALLAACKFAPGNATATDAAATDGARDTSISVDGSPLTTSFVIEAEAFTSNQMSTTRAWSTATTFTAFSGASYMICGPGTGAFCPNDANLDTCAASMRYQFTVDDPAIYYVHARTLGTGSADDSSYYGLDGVAAIDALAFLQDSLWHWRSGTTTFNLAVGVHTLTIWQRECGAKVDVVAVSQSAVPPP